MYSPAMIVLPAPGSSARPGRRCTGGPVIRPGRGVTGTARQCPILVPTGFDEVDTDGQPGQPLGPGRRSEQLELVAVHGPPPGEHRFLHVGAVASGVSDGAGTTAGAAGVGEGAADGVPAVGVVAGIGIRVRFPPAARVLAERIIATMRQHGNGEQGVDPIQQGVAEASLACSLLLPAMVCRLISRPAQQMRAAMRVRLRAVENLALIPTALFVHMQDEHTRIRDALSGCDPSGAVGPCRADRGSGLAQRFSFVLRAVPGVVSRDRDALGRGSRRSPE